ncbi:phospholipase [Luteimonas aestuarii]|uniref:Phospholipase n=2 Tax=Luteimonas aestuarii TaxID=453837 RepID=A0A4R5U1G7_9GAMM|nr:prolyl oligopeptidase family serine peptidase [Luteimonas aestuarii]TDK27404.1 phospholipase [Luteimonas aestuarii]
MPFRLLSWCLLILALAGCSTLRTMISPLPARGVFLEREIEVDGKAYRYQVFAPARGSVEGKPPMVVFLHGSGERGSENRKQAEVGLGPYVRAHADTFPAIVVFPQAPLHAEWNQLERVVFAQMDAAMEEFGGNPDRVVLTGMSMGGYGVWDYGMRAPDRFAALVPVCGGLVHPNRPSMDVRGLAGQADPYAFVAQRVRHVPTWIFHGALDDVVLPEYSRRMAEALQAAGAENARFTEFPDANHNSWDAAYSRTPALWDWAFSQDRSQR